MFTSVLSRWLVDDFSNRSRALVNLSWKYKRKRSKLPEDLLQKSLNFRLHCLVDYDYAQAKINDSGFSKDITCTIGPNLQIRNHSEEVCVQHKRIYWHLIH